MRSSRRAPRPFCSNASQSWAASLPDITRDGLRRADRFGEGAADLDQRFGADRLDRLGDPAGGLVEAAAQLGPEAQRKRCARLRQQIADAVEAEHAETIDQIGRKPQGDDRQAADIGRGLPRSEM